ncbi:protein phosphatase 1G-like [Haliotis rufescens]|uniref:protein phosphatase 1G-like n=1 Tax=Haliotis rufescens TaxID=6454 RepID=UPI001EB0464D|nr:protein phosphatase 1G-like [Haliotis rufescens]
MGVYLSSPITDKISIDNSCKNFRYGASSMQGWRMTQEDAHNCLPDFEEGKDGAFFAVYDGHGGAEVAQYCAMHFPDYVKKVDAYKEGNVKQALEDAFLQFDSTLIEEGVVKELRALAGDDDRNAEEEEDGAVPVGKTEADLLRQEANMPLDELLSKYETAPPGAGPLRDIRKQQGEKVLSPSIRPKKKIFGDETEEADSSVRSGQLLGDGDSRENNANNSSEDSNVNNSSVSRCPMSANIEDKLINGHADNENNLNKEKEIQDSLNQQQRGPTGGGAQRCEEAVSSSSSIDGVEDGAQRKEESDGQITSQSTDRVVSQSSDRTTSSVPGEADACQVKAADSGSSSAGSSSSSGGCSSSAGSSSSSAGAGPGPGPCSSSVDEPCTSGSGGASSSGSNVDGEPGPSGSGSSSGRSPGGILEADSEDDDADEDDEEYEEESDDEEEEEEEEEEEDGEEGEGGYINNPSMDMTNEEPGSDSGCTACVALLLGKELYVANAGDSRCVLSRNGKAVDLSFDHKPEDIPERTRIEKAGGKVTSDGRVNGGLNLSRALGDHFYKRNHELSLREQMITSLPDILVTTLQEEDEFMVLACDGIWNFMSSQEVVDMVRQKLSDPVKREKPSLVCEELFDYCLAPNTFGDGTGCDNMTCIIVTFNKSQDDASVQNNKRCANEMESCSSDEKLGEKKAKVEPESTHEDM